MKLKSSKAPLKSRKPAKPKGGASRKAKPESLAVAPSAPSPGKSGPRLNDDERALLLQLLAAGFRESVIHNFFAAADKKPLSSSTISYYRQQWAKQLAEAKAKRIDEALTSGLALKAERIAALKEHAELLGQIRFVSDKNGRLWNERAWRQTLEDIAIEMGERKPKNDPGEQVVKVYLGVDPDKV